MNTLSLLHSFRIFSPVLLINNTLKRSNSYLFLSHFLPFPTPNPLSSSSFPPLSLFPYLTTSPSLSLSIYIYIFFFSMFRVTHVWNGFHISTLHSVSTHRVPDGFRLVYLVTENTIKRLGIKHCKFIKHIFSIINDVCCMDLSYW